MGMTFDDQAAAYDRWYATPLGQLVDRVEKEAIFALLPEVGGQRVLDVGCGTGNISLALAHRGAQVVGLDASVPMLARARDKAGWQDLSISWVTGAAGQLPFGDGSFDGVVCILALDFIPDRSGALHEMVRVLRPGGFLTVAVLNRCSFWTLKRVIRACFRPSLWREVKFTTSKELWRFLSSRPELGAIQSRQSVYFPPWKNPHLIRYFPYLENLGRKLHLPTGACLVAAARKIPIRSNEPPPKHAKLLPWKGTI
jgi:ubiquinone/menaquinone biosynthesis C-methylase UbiE